MSGSSSQNLQSLLPDLEKTKVPVVKNAILSSSIQSLKICENGIQNSDILEEEAVLKGACKMQSALSTSINEKMEVHSKVSSSQSDAESLEHALKNEMLSNMLNLTDEVDLLCKIPVEGTEISLNNEE